MANVKPFKDLEPYEKEVSKDECAYYLDLYYRFMKEVMKRPRESYISVFKRVRYLNEGLSLNAVNDVACYNEYDYMIQYAEFFTLNKFFSMLIDSNIKYLEDMVANDSVDEKYYVDDSKRFTKKNLISLLRNAFNHNDKEGFQLFRLIKSEKDIDLAVEIYLRKPNLHLKIDVKDLFDIFKDILSISSIYDISFSDSTGSKFSSMAELSNGLKSGLQLNLNHKYNFNRDDFVNENGEVSEITSSDEFNKTISLTDNYIEACKRILEDILRKFGSKGIDALPLLLRDNIPFGMTKVSGYAYDLNFLIRDLFDPNSSYVKYIEKLSEEEYNVRGEESDTLYYSVINPNSAVDRSFSLFASYVLDSVISEDNPQFDLDGNRVNKNHYRNSFVHGRWYCSFDENGKKQFILNDYEHGDNNIMDSSIAGEEEIVVEEEKLYKSLKKYVKKGNYDLPLSFIKGDKDNGYYLTFRVNGVNYFCNMSLSPKIPIFMMMGEKDGKLFTAYGEDFKLLEKLINQTNLDDMDPRMREFIKKLPKIVRKAFFALLDTNSDEAYKRTLKREIEELVEICSEINLGITPGSNVTHFHY